ncbi:hypothetical protein APSETT444_001940 [Aspergillus pseudonomiae]
MQCRPHRAIWEFYLPSKCYSLPDVMLCSAAVQVISDVCMFLLPQKMIWSLHMNWQKKMGISIIFGVGILASIAACFRLAHTVTFAKSTDTMYFIGPLLFWACAEMTCGFFIFSVPCLSKLAMESGLRSRLSSALGLSDKSVSGPSDKGANPNSGPRAKPKPWRISETNYSKIEEGSAIPLTNVSVTQHDPSEGRLSRDENRSPMSVVRTMDVNVSSTDGTGVKLQDHRVPWEH